jgi:hypothetical protein
MTQQSGRVSRRSSRLEVSVFLHERIRARSPPALLGASGTVRALPSRGRAFQSREPAGRFSSAALPASAFGNGLGHLSKSLIEIRLNSIAFGSSTPVWVLESPAGYLPFGFPVSFWKFAVVSLLRASSAGIWAEVLQVFLGKRVPSGTVQQP